MNPRRASCFISGILPFCTPGWTLSAPAPDKPNVVIILADDQGWGDLSTNGNTNLSTPNIDSLAATGVTFDRFYVCPVCSPTRAEFLTGRYHPRGGVHSTSTGGERLDLDERTIAETFKAAGYATGIFGKWHNGTQYAYHPLARGFDEFYGFTSGHWGTYFDPPLDHNGNAVRGKGYITDDLTDHAIGFVEAHREQPFFCYVPFNTPHSPMQVPERFYSKFADRALTLQAARPADEDVAHTRAALAMCENIDWNVGRILRKLNELNLAERTIVIYFSDNGPNGWRWNDGMKGRKGSTDEGGVRSPFFIRWPAKIRGGSHVPQIAGAIDLLPTLADLADIAIVGDKPLDGVSLEPLLISSTDTPASWPDRMIFSHWAGKVSVRTQRYRLDEAGRLFDMQIDPGQQRGIAREHPEIADPLKQAVEAWKQEMLPGLKEDRRPFPVGHPASATTCLPARDGVPHGGVQRSANAPNCSYFKHLATPSDAITWDIEVLSDGEYDAVVHYACPSRDVGSRVELRFADARLEARISEPHDPPLIGAANDRVPRRGESYVKDFKPLRLGTMHLKPGRGTLTLRPLNVPGSQAMEVRMIELIRKR